MRLPRLLDRAYGFDWVGLFGSRTRASVLAAGLLLAIGMILVGLCLNPAGKVDANRITSPWDYSHAPPPYARGASVRLIGKLQPRRASQPPAPIRRAAAPTSRRAL